MLKKTLIGTAIAATLAVFVFGKDVFSYATTSASSLRSAVKSEVPLEFEIERARDIVANLMPDIRHCMHVTAEQQVDIEHLTADIARKDAELDRQQGQILALREDLAGGDETFVYASRTYTSNEVKRDLAMRFERYKSAQEALLRDKQILAARQKALQANQIKLDDMFVEKQKLEVQLEQLDAKLKTIQAAETVSELQIDDSRLSQAKTLIKALNRELDVRELELNKEGKFTSGLIPVDAAEEVPTNIGEQIDEYFGPTETEAGPDVIRLEAASL
jgi:chromosome segregation ATPase